MKDKKVVKLAVIRDNEADPCPFGLSVPFACKNIGEYINRMAPLDALGDDAPPNAGEKIASANQRLMRWALMQDEEQPKPCVYAGKLFPNRDKVECNYGDTAPGVTQKGTLLGSPFYSQYFAGVGLDGLYSYPLGYYADHNISRNLFYGIYSLQGSNIDLDLIKKLAEVAVIRAMDEKSANKIE